TPAPQGFIIELQPLLVNASENHSADKAIPNRQRFQPFFIIFPAIVHIFHRCVGRRCVPQHGVVLRKTQHCKTATYKNKQCPFHTRSLICRSREVNYFFYVAYFCSMAVPLAERLRPRSLSELVGQEHLTGEGSVLQK